MKPSVRHTLFGTPAAAIASVLLAVVLIYLAIGTSLSGYALEDIDWDAMEAPPSAAHWFGTDLAGRDLFTRVSSGGRISLGVAIIATLISVAIGVPYGAFAGYLGGRADHVMMRIVDTLYALPFVLVVILLVVVVGRSTLLLFAALGAVFWLDIARIVRGQTLRIRSATFVEASRGLGGGTTHIVLRHVVPNVAGPALVYATLTVPGVMLAEAFLSFLGLGVQEPDTSWGVLIADGTQNMQAAPWALMFPAAFLAATVWSLNILGDRLRDRLDATTRSRLE